MSELIRINQAGMLNTDIIVAFQDRWGSSGFRRASQTMSALLRAAEKSGKIKAVRTSGPVSGNTTIYWMTAEQVDELRAEAVRRVAKK